MWLWKKINWNQIIQSLIQRLVATKSFTNKIVKVKTILSETAYIVIKLLKAFLAFKYKVIHFLRHKGIQLFIFTSIFQISIYFLIHLFTWQIWIKNGKEILALKYAKIITKFIIIIHYFLWRLFMFEKKKGHLNLQKWAGFLFKETYFLSFTS